MTRLCVVLIVLVLWVWVCAGAMQLRKHHHRVQAPLNESSVVHAMQKKGDLDLALSKYTSSASACGEATLTCMTFGDQKEKLAVRCGMLAKAPVCHRADTQGDQQCDTFCDTDGGARLCQFAFSDCCGRSPNGCVSSKPRQVVVYSQ